MQLGRKAAVDAEELLVHDGRQREGTERVHTCFVDALSVLPLA